ncbi:hypothetical protein HR45_19190 [Shewanella mangrovi]|uniref:Tyr recombinase domain-containing protein n=1 Tax=Shewanella mangrovi TaxID=1515746 RepID=A0A094LLD6_9GAMM|nr:site-specific integrase [Shewanella mangrovi]KFZ35938.1 hypothetical protein HR45_19190 [Shewanella mangrovi]
MNKIAIARTERLRNSGGVSPDASLYIVPLLILFNKLKNAPIKYRAEMTVTAIYIWLKGISGQINNAEDIPELILINGDDECIPNAIRKVRSGNNSWCEYSHPFEEQGTTHYLWFPIPIYFSDYFLQIAREKQYRTPLLNPQGKTRLYRLLLNAWKTPTSLTSLRRVDKDVFQQYFWGCAQADNTLTAPVREVMFPEQEQHHRSASTYLTFDSDRIRGKIFDAYNRYISRLIKAARTLPVTGRRRDEVASCLVLYSKKMTFPLLSNVPELPSYLKAGGKITQYTAIGGYATEAVPPIIFGGKRALDEYEVINFFAQLDDWLCHLKPSKALSHSSFIEQESSWLTFYNAATTRMVLLFILLTGVRPTHAISIEWQYFMGEHVAFVSDKGQLRPIYLSDFLLSEIKHYLAFQTRVRATLPNIHKSKYLWFYLLDSGKTTPLSHKLLQQELNHLWPNKESYQLRHFFSYCASTTTNSYRLYDDDIARLMGHSNLGEHLGSDNIFPATVKKILSYANWLPKRLRLREMSYE